MLRLLNRLRGFSSTGSVVVPESKVGVVPDNMVRLIDAEGKNQGMVLKDSISVPIGFQLSQVAAGVCKLLPIPNPDAPKSIVEEKKKMVVVEKPSIVKTVQLRPAIAAPDLERMLDRVRIWLDKDDHKRVSAVNILIRREGGAKARARGTTADALLEQVIQTLHADGYKPASIKKEGMELSCLINKRVRSK